MTFIIDGHIDLAYESLQGRRDYTRSAAETRSHEPENIENQSMVGWPELQKGNIGIVFSTVFLDPPDCRTGVKSIGTSYDSPDECHASVSAQLDFYHRWQEQHPEKFNLIRSKSDFKKIVETWESQPANYPQKTNPVGLVILWEGAEGLRSFNDLDEYYERGMRIIGPVWEGGRWCGGSFSTKADRFTPAGRELLDVMAAKGFILDTAHMNTRSANEALDQYPGVIIASHCNCRVLLKNPPNERHFTDETIAHLIERDGVMGVLPYNEFLDTEWKSGDQRSRVTLNTLTDHIDHICQIAGDSFHTAIGSDSDGGFGYPNIPEEMNDISDLQKLEIILLKRGYTTEDINNIFNRNWSRILERALK
ncbi:MAG: dipeptidase [Flexilinea sp.]|jgi:membrane dipeptidase